jgi:preprotein translocase subunit SecA
VIQFILKNIIGSKNARELKKLQPKVNAIGELEPKMKAKSDDELKAMTAEFKQRLDNGATLDDLLIEAFAVCRETGRRVLNMRHYDVQLEGGMVQHRGAITEMKTGEGKTLVATLPLYLNALTERGCHLVTVNDYLASRDAEWMGKIYNFLGLSVGTIYHDMSDQLRQKAYRSDITYGQNNEFGFDYLRDNMKESIELYVQRELNFAIVDEVDSILIDEARTPLIISGPAEQSADLYHRVNQVIPSLKKDVDYTVDEKGHSAMLTDTGVEGVEKRLAIGNLYDPTNLEWLHNVTQALRAHTLYKRDVNYLVDDGKVIIIDEFTGRKMPGRRWSDGLHQAVEAKENVTIEEENQTLATITFQNYFRMYNKLAGMTGTAETEAEEFYKIYKLDVSVIPTNMPMIRDDHDDVIYKSEKAKFKHVIEEIKECHKRGQPVLVGTISVEKSEVLSKMLRKQGIKHNVLNAKNHGREAEFVAQAGRKCALTLSTNMAGRGTDIVLGGNAEMMAKGVANPEEEPDKYKQAFEEFTTQCKAEREVVLAAGGMHILGTERYEARRVDNQLRGRAGRQGDPGTSRFYLSLEDDLLRIFGAERIQNLMDRLGMEEDERIEHKWVNKAISNAQKKVEGHNFDIRKHLLEYDNVMNQQRKTIYSLRKQVLEGRYAPELSDAEKKEGKQPKVPEKSGEWTVEKLSETLRPRIKQILDDFYSAAQDGDGSDRDPYRGAKGKQDKEAELPETATVDHEELTRELYRFFGAMIDLLHEAKHPVKCLNKATKEIAAALIQQRERILDLCDETIGGLIATQCPTKVHAEEWNMSALEDACKETFNCAIAIKDIQMDQGLIAEKIWEQVEKVVEAREEELGPIYFLYFARHFFLEEIDNQWIEHLKAMDQLREGIGLRGYGQRDPKQEYKKEGYNMFAVMMDRINSNVIGKIFRVQVEVEDEAMPEYRHKKRRMSMGRGAAPSDGGGHEVAKTVRRATPKIGRNDPCPCGSGKKYKKCCMARDQATS